MSNKTLRTKILQDNNIELIEYDEVFKKIPKYKNYYISNYGRLIRTYNNGKAILIKPEIVTNGYLAYRIYNGTRKYRGKAVKDKQGNVKRIKKRTTAHRLVAIVFVDNYYKSYAIDELQVHHKDKNINNNYYKNLIWLPVGVHTFIHRINKIGTYSSGTGNFRTYKDIEKVAQICKLNIAEFLELLEEEANMPIDHIKNWCVYRINTRYIGVQWNSKSNR